MRYHWNVPVTRALDECGKHAHATRRKAHLHIRQLKDYSLVVYPCPYGAGFHVGHRAGDQPKRDRIRKQERMMARKFDWRAALSEDAA